MCAVLALCAGWLHGEEQAVSLAWPTGTGDFYASGTVAFPPGNVPATANILVRPVAPEEEIAAQVKAAETWPDGSVLSAEITFAANASRKRDYLIVSGGQVRRRKSINETAVLPTVAFATGGAPKSAEKMDMNVGQINVRVDRSLPIRYYWHIFPIGLLLALVIYRTRKANRVS
jgi:hypothetical protein